MKIKNRRSQGFIIWLGLSVLLAGALLARETPQTVPAGQESVSVIKEITYQKFDIAEQLQVMIKVEGPFSIEITELMASKRLIIDINSVSKVEAQPIYQVNDAGLLTIRSGQFQTNVARVVFDLANDLPPHSISTEKTGVKVVFGKNLKPTP